MLPSPWCCLVGLANSRRTDAKVANSEGMVSEQYMNYLEFINVLSSLKVLTHLASDTIL